MPQKGFVYILTNKSMPNTVKVGKTTKTPDNRAQELASTGVPTPFEIEYYAFFDDMDAAERIAHQMLARNHHGKEFFAVDVATAIVAVENTGISFQKLFSKTENDRKAEGLRRQQEEKNRQALELRNAEAQRKAEEQKAKKRELDKQISDTLSFKEEILKTIHLNNCCILLGFTFLLAGGFVGVTSQLLLLKGSGALLFIYGAYLIAKKYRRGRLLDRCACCGQKETILPLSRDSEHKYRCIACGALIK